MESMLFEIETSEFMLEFSGSSENDVSFAKKFWHSGSLLPYVESNLQSEGLMQRLRTAPFPGHGGPKYLKSNADDKLSEFFRKALETQHLDELKRIERLSHLREADRTRLLNQQLKRQQLEEKFKKRGTFRIVPSAVPVQSQSEAIKTMADIEKFENSNHC